MKSFGRSEFKPMKSFGDGVKHTPTPWKTGGRIGSLNIDAENGRGIATCGYTDTSDVTKSLAENVANAEFIVRACNSHDDLIHYLKRIAQIAEIRQNENLNDATIHAITECMMSLAKEALAKAEGKGE